MNIAAILVLSFGLGAATFGILRRWTKVLKYPPISDQEFLERISVDSSGQASALKLRRKVASVLGIPPSRLSPDFNLAVLSSSIGFMGSFSVGWSDLEAELLELCLEKNLEYRPFETIGEYIEEYVRLMRA